MIYLIGVVVALITLGLYAYRARNSNYSMSKKKPIFFWGLASLSWIIPAFGIYVVIKARGEK